MTLDQSTMPPKSTDKKAAKKGGNVFIDIKRASAPRKAEQDEERQEEDDEEEDQPKSRKQSKPEGVDKIGQKRKAGT